MGRYISDKNKKIKKEKKNTKILILFVAIVIIFSIIISIRKNNVKGSDNQANEINIAFSYLKEGNSDKINEYIDYNQLIDSFDEIILQEPSQNSKDVQKMLFDKLSWNIKNMEVQDEKVIATIEVTNKDFKNIITKWMQNLVEKKENEKAIDNELAMAELKDVLNQESEMKTTTETVILKKENEKWKIEMNDNFVNLVFPGIDIIQQLLNS